MPVHPAPKEWVAEVKSRLIKLTAAAGEEMIKGVRGPDHAGLRYDEASMGAWRKLAVFVINRGAWKGKREELGVLAEVFGLEDRGTFCKA